jgi:HlyD family secretion protein
VADLSAFRAEAELSDAYSSRLAPGQPARVVVDGEEIAATVSQIYPAVEDGAVRFAVDLADPAHPKLRPNLRVDVLVVTERRPDALRVARGPFAEGGGRRRVLVVDGDRAVAREVVFGLVGHRDLEVVEGLAAGERVVVSDAGDLLRLDEVPLR